MACEGKTARSPPRRTRLRRSSLRREGEMADRPEGKDGVDSPLWLRGLAALLLLLLGGAISWAVWIAALNFQRIGV